MFTPNDDALEATLEFKDFAQTMAYMVEASFQIEQQHHHPEWTNVYNKLTIRLTTHDAGNTITDKDHALAKALTELYHRYQ